MPKPKPRRSRAESVARWLAKRSRSPRWLTGEGVHDGWWVRAGSDPKRCGFVLVRRSRSEAVARLAGVGVGILAKRWPLVLVLWLWRSGIGVRACSKLWRLVWLCLCLVCRRCGAGVSARSRSEVEASPKRKRSRTPEVEAKPKLWRGRVRRSLVAGLVASCWSAPEVARARRSGRCVSLCGAVSGSVWVGLVGSHWCLNTPKCRVG